MGYSDTVSIIIPVYNEEKYIETCLNSILNQSYENITEILIFDGMSIDNTRSIINSINDKRIALIDNKRKIQSAGLNEGIKIAKGDIVVRIDAHAVYDENYVKECVSALNRLKDENVVNVGGPTYLVTSGNYVEDCIVFLHESKFGIGVAKFRQKDYEGYVDTVWNGAFYRWVFDKVGLYNEELKRSEDNDMNNRIVKAGYKIYQNKNVIAYYKPRVSVKKVLNQNLENGKAIGNSLVNNREIIRIRHLVPAAFFASIIFFGVMCNYFYLGKVMEIFVLGSYFLIDLIESLRIGFKNEIKYIPLMFVLFFLLHIYYGVGTFIGFFQQLLRSNEG